MFDALIFDDDVLFGKLMTEYFAARSLSVKHYPDGNRALEHIHEDHPTMVLVDVMMPGLDGISICKQVKADAKLGKTKVVVVTGKSYTEDKTRALWAKADLFVEKPMNLPRFSDDIDGWLAKPAAVPALRPYALKFYQPDAAPGVGALIWNGTQLVALDAGPGLAALAADRALLSSVKEAWILLSHFHRDHISGLSSAAALARLGIKVHIAGPRDEDIQLSQIIRRAFSVSTEAEALLPSIAFYQLTEGSYQLFPGFKLKAIHAMHPGPCLAYRIDGEAMRLVFAPDSEVALENGKLGDYGRKLALFSKDAGLIIHDGRYSDADAERPAKPGHSSACAAALMAAEAGAKKLLLHHLDPSYNDLQIIALRNEALAACERRVEIDLPRHGLSLEF